MKRRNPDKQLAELITDLTQTQAAKNTLLPGAYQYTNDYSTKQLLRLFRIILERLLPNHAVKLFALFMGAMSMKAAENLGKFYGPEVSEWVTMENGLKWHRKGAN